jgi:hypothetical protein
MRIERYSMVVLARFAPAKPPTYRYDAAKSEMASQPRRASLYNSANTKRYVAEALAVSGLADRGAVVWLYVRGGNRERDVTTAASVHVVPTGTGLAFQGSSEVATTTLEVSPSTRLRQ